MVGLGLLPVLFRLIRCLGGKWWIVSGSCPPRQSSLVEMGVSVGCVGVGVGCGVVRELSTKAVKSGGDGCKCRVCGCGWWVRQSSLVEMGVSVGCVGVSGGGICMYH